MGQNTLYVYVTAGPELLALLANSRGERGPVFGDKRPVVPQFGKLSLPPFVPPCSRRSAPTCRGEPLRPAGWVSYAVSPSPSSLSINDAIVRKKISRKWSAKPAIHLAFSLPASAGAGVSIENPTKAQRVHHRAVTSLHDAEEVVVSPPGVGRSGSGAHVGFRVRLFFVFFFADSDCMLRR